MDQVAPAAYNPHLQRVLKSFQCAAEASLSGPSRYMAVWTHQQDPTNTDHPSVRSIPDTEELRKAMISSSLIKKTVPSDKLSNPVGEGSGNFYPTGAYPGAPVPAPVAHLGPVFLPMDTSHSERADTFLEGDTISCFVVGGEKRLCLPQILNTVLQDFSLQQINTICDDLHIFCSRCTIQQLDLLKMTGVLPPSAPSCGLITKTDAERLCNALLHSSPERSIEPPSASSFKVYHECFGKCKGVFCPELYTSTKARCIECWECHGMFAPQKFVCHSHKARENRTCHWGFDSANWRAYLLLAKDQDCRDLMQRALDGMKDKFDVTGYKKKRGGSSERSEDEAKRARFEQNGMKGFDGSAAWLRDYQRGLSAFRPWSPTLETLIKEGKIPAPGSRDEFLPNYLQQGPPVLLNPERVVPFNDRKRYDRHFAPNVSLAPQTLGKEDDKQSIERFPDIANTNRMDPKLLSSTSTYSMSSVSTLSSPSPVKVERHPDLDLSSSDESSFRSESVPSTPRDEHRSIADVTVPVESDLTTDRNLMLSLVRRALEVSADTNPDDHEVILEQIAEVWARQEDRIRALVQSRKHLLQEMELLRVSKHDRLQEMSESRLTLRHEVERLQCQLEAKSREALIERQKLQKELDLMKMSRNPELSKIKNKYKGQIEGLKGRLEHYQCLNTSMAVEIDCLNKRLSKLGHNVSGLSSAQQTAAPVTKECCNKAIKEETTSDTYTGDKMEESIGCSENGYHDPRSDDEDIEVMEDTCTELMEDT